MRITKYLGTSAVSEVYPIKLGYKCRYDYNPTNVGMLLEYKTTRFTVGHLSEFPGNENHQTYNLVVLHATWVHR